MATNVQIQSYIPKLHLHPFQLQHTTSISTDSACCCPSVVDDFNTSLNQTYIRRGANKQTKHLPVEGSEEVWDALVLSSVTLVGETVVDFKLISFTVDSVVFTGMLVAMAKGADVVVDGVVVAVMGSVVVVVGVLVVLVDGVGVGKVMMVVVVVVG